MKRALLLLAGCAPLIASATFVDNFDADHTANWKFNSSVGTTDTANNGLNNDANFYFDYGTLGIVSAPHSTGGTTRGLKMVANITGSVFSGLSVSPLGQSFSGDYELSFDAWQNFHLTGNGTTQLMVAGIDGNTSTAQFPGGTFNGIGFAATCDGGSGTDFRGYNGSGVQIAATNFPNGQNNGVGTFYATNFGAGAVPTGQAAFAAANGIPGVVDGTPVTAAQKGSLGMAWHYWQISRVGTTVTWKVDGLTIATMTGATTGNSNIFLGQFDSNTASSTDTWNSLIDFAVVDNVTATPEPGTWAALGLGAVAVLRRRRAR